VMLPKEGKRSTEDWVCCPETAWVDYFGVPVESASVARNIIKGRRRLSAPSCACLRRTFAMRCCADLFIGTVCSSFRGSPHPLIASNLGRLPQKNGVGLTECQFPKTRLYEHITPLVNIRAFIRIYRTRYMKVTDRLPTVCRGCEVCNSLR